MNTRSTTRAPWWGNVLALLGLALFCGAGVWQLGRADQKRTLAAAFASGGVVREGLPADSEAADLRYQRLRLAGRYDGERQILLDNMIYDGRAGYHVLTPLRTGLGTVLVNRGWVPADGDRRRLPAIGVAEGTRTVTGRLDFLPVPGLRLAPAGSADPGWPRRLQFPTPAELSAVLGYPVQTYQLLLDPAEPDGFLREWQPATMAAEQHLAYAVQWFGLAGAVIVIYAVLVFRRRP